MKAEPVQPELSIREVASAIARMPAVLGARWSGVDQRMIVDFDRAHGGRVRLTSADARALLERARS